MSGAKKITQLPQKSNLNDDDLFVIVDSQAGDNKSARADAIKSYVGSVSNVDWNNITNKPSQFPPIAHTHTKADITDFAHTHTLSEISNFPVGVNGDVFIHDGISWSANNIIEYRDIAWFSANANNVLRKNTIIVLDDDRAFFKMGDGVSALKNLRWMRVAGASNYASLNISQLPLFAYDSVNDIDITTNLPSTNFTTSTISSSFNNRIQGSFFVVSEPIMLRNIGVKITSITGTGISIDVGVYNVDVNTRIITKIAERLNVSISSVGVITTPSFDIKLSSGIYYIVWRWVVPSTTSFSFELFNANNIYSVIRFPLLGGTSNNMLSWDILGVDTSLANNYTIGTTNTTSQIAYCFYIFCNRLLKNL